MHNPNYQCNHGHNLWWNYGDGMPRHIIGDQPRLQICESVGYDYRHIDPASTEWAEERVETAWEKVMTAKAFHTDDGDMYVTLDDAISVLLQAMAKMGGQ